MKSHARLSQLFRSITGKTTHTPTPETNRDKLAQWYIPKVAEEMR